MADDCVEWEGARNRQGYGILPKKVDGSRLAHRAALSAALGRPVEGVVRHVCDNPPCVNPEHLLEGTQAENMLDAMERGRVKGGRADQTHCSRGHELTEENVRYYWAISRGKKYQARYCRVCRHLHSQKQAAKRKAARHARGLLRARKETV